MEYLKPKRKYEDWTGKVFSRLTVIELLGVHPTNNNRYWKCICVCGGVVEANAALLKAKVVKSCGCARVINDRSIDPTDIVGKTFGKLTIKEVTDKQYIYTVKCDCGSEFRVNRYDILNAHTKSCGCLRTGNASHGKTDTRTYRIWSAMKARCLRKTASNYKWYGGKGISVCDEWLTFENFYQDMGDPPSSVHTLDRVDSNGDYSRENCRWVTAAEQQRNKTSNVVYEFEGSHYSLKELAVKAQIKESTLSGRIYTGMSITEAISGHRQSPQTRKRLAGILRYESVK